MEEHDEQAAGAAARSLRASVVDDNDNGHDDGSTLGDVAVSFDGSWSTPVSRRSAALLQ